MRERGADLNVHLSTLKPLTLLYLALCFLLVLSGGEGGRVDNLVTDNH